MVMYLTIYDACQYLYFDDRISFSSFWIFYAQKLGSCKPRWIALFSSFCWSNGFNRWHSSELDCITKAKWQAEKFWQIFRTNLFPSIISGFQVEILSFMMCTLVSLLFGCVCCFGDFHTYLNYLLLYTQGWYACVECWCVFIVNKTILIYLDTYMCHHVIMWF